MATEERYALDAEQQNLEAQKVGKVMSTINAIGKW